MAMNLVTLNFFNFIKLTSIYLSPSPRLYYSTNWGSWKTFVCKGGTVSPRRRKGMCALHRPVLCRGLVHFPSLPDLSPRMPRLPSQGGTCRRSVHQDPSPRGLEWWPHKDQRSAQLLCPQRSLTSRAPSAQVLIVHFCL